MKNFVIFRPWDWCRAIATVATKTDLATFERKIMSAISDFAANVKDSFTELATAVDGVVSDVNQLKAKIDQLQNSPGQITPEDQATLDAIQAQAKSLADKVKSLDEATAPSEVPTPPTP